MKQFEYYLGGIKKAFFLVGQIYPVSLGGLALGVMYFQIAPWLLVFMISPIAIHLWSGFLYAADKGCCQWTWRSRGLLVLALSQILVIGSTMIIVNAEMREALWIYAFSSCMWTFFAWIIGAMALADDWM